MRALATRLNCAVAPLIRTILLRTACQPQLIYRLLGYGGLAAFAILMLQAGSGASAVLLLVFAGGWPLAWWWLAPHLPALHDAHAPGASIAHGIECLTAVTLLWVAGAPDWLVLAVSLLGLSGVTALGGLKVAAASAIALGIFLAVAMPWRESAWDGASMTGGLLTAGCLLMLAWQAHRQARRLNAGRRQALTESSRLRRHNDRLSRYLPKALPPAVRSRPLSPQPPTEVFVTVAFLDLVGFAELVACRSVAEVVDVLNDFMAMVSGLTSCHGGELGKFLGDGVLVYFAESADARQAAPGSARVLAAAGCIRLARALGGALDDLSRSWRGRGLGLSLELRVGVASGYCALGDWGGQNRLDYTLIGTPVNLASRLQALAKPGSVLVSSATASLIAQVPELGGFLGAPQRLQVKGLGVVVVHEVNGSAKVRAIPLPVNTGNPDARE